MKRVLSGFSWSLVFLLISSLLPIWNVWHIGSWEANGHPGQFLWTVCAEVPGCINQVGLADYVFKWNCDNWVTAGFVACLGFVFGVWRKRRQMPLPPDEPAPDLRLPDRSTEIQRERE
jgi:hypothetical protein